LIDGESVNPALAKNYGQNINIYHTYEKVTKLEKEIVRVVISENNIIGSI
jgi:hypothetical protein